MENELFVLAGIQVCVCDQINELLTRVDTDWVEDMIDELVDIGVEINDVMKCSYYVE